MSNFISQNILEVRLEKKCLHFLDLKGKILDELLKKINYDKFSISQTGDRIEVASKKEDVIYFFSVYDFGIKLKKNIDFTEFISGINDFFAVFEEIELLSALYNKQRISRIGTRSIIHDKIYNLDFKGTKNRYQELFFNSSVFNHISDLGIILDTRSGNKKINLQTGPMKKEQALQDQFFGDDCDNIKKDGFFFNIDCFEDDTDLMIDSNLALKDVALSNIDCIKDYFVQFKNELEENKE